MTMPEPRRPFAVLFDLDGTLVDSIGLLLASVRHTFTGRNRAPSEEAWIASLGTPLAMQLRPYVDSEEDVEALVSRYREFQRAHHDRLMSAYDGVNQALQELAETGHPMGVVTSKSNEMMDRALAYLGLDRYMKTTIGCDSCSIHKPDPFPVRMALGELGYGPHEAVFVGDSPHDIVSGNAAGVATAAALWGPFTREQLEPYSPTLFLERITQLPGEVARLERMEPEL